MRGNEFLNKLENIDPAYIEAAGQATKKEKSPYCRKGLWLSSLAWKRIEAQARPQL